MASAGLRSRVLKGCLGLVGMALLGLALCLALAVWLVSPAGRTWILERSLDAINDFLPEARLEVDALEANLQGHLAVRGARLLGPEGQELAGVDRVAVDLLPDPWKRDLEVRSLLIERPRADLHVLPDGRLDLVAALGLGGPHEEEEPSAPWKGLPFAIRLNNLDIREAAVAWTDGATSLAVDDLALNASGFGEGRQIGLDRLAAGAVVTLVAEGREPFVQRLGLGGAVSLENERLLFQALRLRLGEAGIQVDGAVSMGGSTQDAGVASAPELDTMLILAGLEPLLFAPLIGDIGIAGPLGGQIRIRGPQGALVLDGYLVTPGGEILVVGGANLDAQPPTWKVEARLPDFELDRLVRAVTEPTLLVGRLAVVGSGTAWPQGVEAQATLELGSGVAWGQPFQSLSLGATVRDGRARLDRLALVAPLGRATGTGTVDLASYVADLDLDLSGLDLGSMDRFGVAGLTGRAATRCRVQVVPERGVVDVTVRGELDIVSGSYSEDIRFDRASGPLEMTFSPAGIFLSGTLAAEGVHAYGADLDVLTARWTLSVEDGVTAWLVQADLDGVTYAPATIRQLRAEVQGSLDAGDPGMGVGNRIVFDGEGLDLAGLGADTFQGQVILHGDALSLALDGSRGADPSLGLDLAYDLGTGDVRARRLMVAPSPEVHWENRGPLVFRVDEGAILDLDLVLGEGPEASGPAPTGSQPAHVAASLILRGDFDPKGALALNLEIVDVTLDPLVAVFPMLPPGIRGQTRLTVNLGGTLEALEVGGHAEVHGLRLPRSVQDLDAVVDFQGGDEGVDFHVEIPERPVEKPGSQPESGTVRVRGREPAERVRSAGSYLAANGHLPVRLALANPALNMESPWNMEIRVHPGSLDRWERILEDADLPDADVSARLVVGGSPEAMTLGLHGVAESPVGDEGQRMRMEFSLEQTGGEVAIRTTLLHEMRRRAYLEGHAQTRVAELVRGLALSLSAPDGAPHGEDPAPGDLATYVHDMDLTLVPQGISAELVRNFVDLPTSLQGNLNGRVHVTGDVARPMLDADLALTEARLGEQRLDPARLEIKPANGGYDVDLAVGFNGTTGFEAVGYVPLDLAAQTQGQDLLAQSGLALEIRGEGIPMQALASALGEITDAEGILKVSGRVIGTFRQPLIQLDATIDQGALSWRTTGIRYSDIRLEASMRGNDVTLTTFEARTRPIHGRSLTGSGGLDVKGTAHLENWVPTDVAISATADKLWIGDTSLLRLSLTGDVGVRGAWPGIQVFGNVRVDEAEVVADQAVFLSSGTLEVDPSLNIHWTDQAPATPQPDTGPPWYEHAQVGIGVDLGRATKVLVKMPFDDTFGAVYAALATLTLEAQLDGELAVAIDKGQLQMGGEVTPLRGAAEVLGAEFDLEEGRVSFVSNDPLDPILDLKAVHHTGQYGDVDLAISGGLEDLSLVFSSADYPDQTDIASLLIFGRPQSERSSEEGQSSSQLLAMATGALMGELERTLGSSLFDLFQIDASDSGAVGAVRVGYAIGDNLFLIVSVRPEADVDGGENLTEATVEWTIGRRWIVDVVTGDQGASSADLLRTWRF